jgi:hypothetical protein
LSTKENKEEAAKLLSIFKLENRKELDIDQEFEYNNVYPNTPSIDTIVFGTPKGEWYSSVNTTLKDSRYLPTTASGKVIRKFYLKSYLVEHLQSEVIAS